MAAVTFARARQLFDLVNRRLCCPGSASAPCIPFHYPDDGCWARAHEMCRLMIAEGEQPEKIWIYGQLVTPTRNHPACKVGWGYHVAPTLQVSVGGVGQTYVMDPALFTEPVPEATWKGAQGDPFATLEHSGAGVYYKPKGDPVGVTDPTYSGTAYDLQTYRLRLRLRATGPDGPPPYAVCAPKPPGVQWLGVIAGGATRRWFTWGWNPARHVFWTIMPRTPCPGGPQLSWRVQVERASATGCTYWITVRNLTGDPVSFEGRYDILS
jgi:hypothetical protein